MPGETPPPPSSADSAPGATSSLGAGTTPAPDARGPAAAPRGGFAGVPSTEMDAPHARGPAADPRPSAHGQRPAPLGSPIPLPRSLVFLATIWLVVSWGLTVGFERPVQPSSSTYEPGVRLMLGSLMAGLLIAWPVMRLSQPASPHPVRQTVIDLFVLLSMVQVVVWPLRLVTRWTVDRTAAIDGVLIGWLLLAGAVVASAIGTHRLGPRLLALAALLGFALGGPLVWLLQPPEWVTGPTVGHALARMSPFMFTHHLGDGGGAPLSIRDWRWVGLLNAAAVVAWATLLATRAGAHASARSRVAAP